MSYPASMFFIGAPAGQVLLKKITEDLYEGAKKLLRDRRKAKKKRPAEEGVGRHLGFQILGPNVEVLKEWTAKDGDNEIDKK
jgi:hypothetical protein